MAVAAASDVISGRPFGGHEGQPVAAAEAAALLLSVARGDAKAELLAAGWSQSDDVISGAGCAPEVHAAAVLERREKASELTLRGRDEVDPGDEQIHGSSAGLSAAIYDRKLIENLSTSTYVDVPSAHYKNHARIYSQQWHWGSTLLEKKVPKGCQHCAIWCQVGAIWVPHWCLGCHKVP